MSTAAAFASVLATTSAGAQPGAFRARDTEGATRREADTANQVPRADQDEQPSDEELAAAPPAHRASGRLREHEEKSGALRAVGNGLLWVPRTVVELGLWGPDLLAGRVDDYLDSRGPNVYGRGNQSSTWSLAAMLAWEAPFGPSVGARVGRGIGRRVRANLTGVAFGRYGYTGRAGVDVEPPGPAHIEIDGEYAHDRELVFAGIGDHALTSGMDLDPFGAGPENLLDDRALSAGLGVPVDFGRLRLHPSARFERHEVAPDDPGSFAYDRAALVGLDQTLSAGTGRLDVIYDARTVPYPWIPLTAPASGWRAHAWGGYTAGDEFATARYGGSAERLFDLFRGTRVLILRARFDATTGDRREVPFLFLPSLGGPDRMRAFSRGRFRDQVATYGEVAYEWAVGLNARASLFVEVGGVHEGLDAVDADPLHLSSGASFRFAGDESTDARAVVAGSSTGELGFYILLGGV